MRFVLTFAAAVVAALMALFGSFARAMTEGEGGWIGMKHARCCSVSGGDCRKIPKHNVIYDPMGQQFLFAYDRFQYLVPEADILHSEDDQYWACFDPTGAVREKCFFRPSMGI